MPGPLSIRATHLAAVFLLAVCAAPAPAIAAIPPGLIDRVLPNGLEVTILPDSSLPVVATRLWYHVGSANEAPGERGYAHLFEHLMFGGTRTVARGAWEAHVHRFGGNENAETWYDETRYESSIAPEGFPEVLAMEADRMTNLRLDESNLANEKRIVTEELRADEENDPLQRLLSAALKALCGRHPYALSPLGTREDIARATLPSVRAFYARYYRPDNAHLVIVGPVDAKATFARAKRHFGSIPRGGNPPADVPSLFAWKFPSRVALKEDLPPANVAVLAYPMPPPESLDDPALCVVRELLGGGQLNPFKDDLVRRRRQALEAGCQSLLVRRGGVLCLYSAVLPYRSERGQFAVMNESVRNLAKLDWLTDAALAGVKARLVRRMENRRYSAGEQADALAEGRWWRGDARSAFDQADRIAAVSRAEVAAAFERYLAHATPAHFYAQPQKVPFLIWMFGWLYPLVSRWV